MMVEMENWPGGAVDDGLNELDGGRGASRIQANTLVSRPKFSNEMAAA